MSEQKKVLILGLGGGGGKIVAGMASKGLVAAADCHVLDSDSEYLQALSSVTVHQVGAAWTRGEGCGGQVSLGEKAVNQYVNELKTLFSEADMVIIVACLGGGLASGSVKVVARIIRDLKISSMFLLAHPFAYEGNNKRHIAEKTTATLYELAEAVVTVQNDILFKVLPPDANGPEAFQVANSMLGDALKGLIQVFSSKGMMPADFADFKAVLRHKHTVCTLGIGRGTGDGRGQKAVDDFFSCPLLGGKETIKEADAGIITLQGGMNLSVNEISHCLSVVKDEFHDEANLVTGVYANEALQDDILITGLVCKYQKNKKGTKVVKDYKTTSVPKKQDDKQGELNLQVQELGIFSSGTRTVVQGQNLDIPTFQRKGITLDI